MRRGIVPTLLRDLHVGARALRRNPGFAAVAVAVLALGIGANTAVFSIVNALLVRPLPGADSGTELLGLFGKDTKRPDRYRSFSYPNYLDISEGARSFSSIAAHDLTLAGVTEGDITRRTFVDMVSANYFETLGARLTRGRAFTTAEEQPGRPTLVAIVPDSYWRKTGADPEIIDKTVRLSGRTFTIVGVAPPGFTGPTAAVAPELRVPLGASELVKNDFMRDGEAKPPGARDVHELMLVGRLRPGVSRAAADRELAQVALRLEQASPAENRDHTIVTAPLPRMGISTSPSDDVDGPIVLVSIVLMAMSAIVLLVACLNLANMLLARGTARRREIAIRLSLGAGRAAVVRQLLTEGFLLAVAGGLLGTLLAYAATAAFIQTVVPIMPVPIDVDAAPDWRVMAATLAFAALATMIFALGPAWRVTRPDVLEDLREQRSEERGRRARLLGARNILIASQMALSLALLVAGALFVRGAVKAAGATPGFSFDRGLLVEIDPGLAAYSSERSAAAHRGLLSRLRTVPGVEAVSMASLVPFGSVRVGQSVERATGTGEAAGGQGQRERASSTYTVISADYFRSLGLTMRRGREFTAQEAEGTAVRRVAIIDEPLARRLFPSPGENPVGQYVRVTAGRDRYEAPVEIIGVAPGLRDDLFEPSVSPHIYVPFSARTQTWMNYHVRLAAGGPDESAMLETIRREVRAFDERLPVLTMTTLKSFGDRSIFLWVFRAAARVFTAFGLSALLLALVGIYGVNAYVVARRTREIGIRVALGATAGGVVRLMLRDTAVVALAGIAVGLGLSVALGYGLSSMLYEVSATDPLALTVEPLLLAAAAAAAALVPTWRATRESPVEALRRE